MINGCGEGATDGDTDGNDVEVGCEVTGDMEGSYVTDGSLVGETPFGLGVGSSVGI